jgi:hypothetical protein
MKKLLLFAFALLVLTTIHQSANARQTPNNAQTIAEAIKMLNGTWEWTETRFASRGVKPTTKTPTSEKKRITLTFKPDNMVTIFQDGKMLNTYEYTVTNPMNEQLMIAFKGKDGQPVTEEFLPEGPLTVSKNQIYIAGGYNDAGSNVSFKKVQAVKKTTQAKKPAKKKK